MTETTSAGIRRMLEHFVRHYEPWMDGHEATTRSFTFAPHTIGDIREARALLAKPEPTEHAWVVANSGHDLFRAWGDSGPEWTGSVETALQFARRVDAERFAAEDPDAWGILPVATLPDTPISTSGLEELGVLGPLLLELDTMERNAEKCEFLVREHLTSWAQYLRGVVTGSGLPPNRLIPGPTGISVTSIVELLQDLVSHRDLSEHACHVLLESGQLLREYEDEVCEILASRPGQWSAWSQTETDSDPSDPLCGHSEVWQVGWWQGSRGDPDMVIRARSEAEAKSLATELNRVLTPRSHSQEPWSEDLNLSDKSRELCRTDPALQSLLYDLDLLPEQLGAQEERTPGLVKAFHRLYGVLYGWQARDVVPRVDPAEAVREHQLQVLQTLDGHQYAQGTQTFVANGQQIRDKDGNLEFIAVQTLQQGHGELVRKIEALLDGPIKGPSTPELTPDEIHELRLILQERWTGQ